MTEQPHHFGPATRLEEYSGLHVDRYFFVTPVSQWSLTSFYNTCSDHRTFMDGLDKISQWKAVDRAIRSYSYAWFSFLDGELGQLRIEAIRKGVTADLTSEIVVTEERQLAQQKLRSRLGRELVMNKEPHELPPESPRSFLGKRPRKDEHTEERSSNKKTTHINNPFMVEENDGDHDSVEQGPTTVAEEQDFRPLNVIFDCKAFEFNCVLKDCDISESFNSYYEDAIAERYDPDFFQDFLATGGILFLGEEPTNTQRSHLGEHFEVLREAMLDHNNDDEAEDAAVNFCQEVRRMFRKTERSDGCEQARKELKKRVEREEDSPLKSLYEHAVKLPKDCAPVSKADQTSTFILGMLKPIFDRPDFSRLAHTATIGTSGSIFVRLCQGTTGPLRNPDLLVRFKERLDVGVAEVSFQPSKNKDIGELCRVALWSKRILDEIVSKFEGTEDITVIFFQVIGQSCNFYSMKRAGTVCIAMKLAQLKIAYTVSDILKDFEDNVLDWLLVCRTFDNFVTTLKSARMYTQDSPSPPVFITPQSWHMKADTRHPL